MIGTVAGQAAALPLAVAIPLGAAVVTPLVGRVSGRLAIVVSIGSLAASAVLLAVLMPTVLGGRPLVEFLGHWGPEGGQVLGVTFVADPLGITFATAYAGIGALLLVHALSEMGEFGPKELSGFASLFLLLVAGLIGSALTADAINLFVWFEVSALASYALTAFYLDRPTSLEAAFKLLVLTGIASFLVFIASSVLYAEHGALNFGQLHDTLRPGAHALDAFALGLLLAGFGTKAGLVPFHTWLPDAHSAAPGPVSALFSGLMVDLGVLSIVRYAFLIFEPDHLPILGTLTVLGGVSAVLGAAMALAQDDLKRLLAYDTISQIGVVLLAFGTGTDEGVAGGTEHLLNHVLFKSLLFLCAGVILHTTGETHLSRMGGLARRKPALAALFVVGIAALVGVPPLNGYASLVLIHGAVKHHPVTFVVLLAVEAATAAALGRAAWLAFFRPRAEPYEGERAMKGGMFAAIGGLAAGCLAFGVGGSWITEHVAGPVAGTLLDPRRYADAALGLPGVRLPHPGLEVHLADPLELGIAAAVLALGLALAWVAVRRPVPSPIRWLQAAHTGRINDYAAYLAGGLIAVTTGLLVAVR